MGEIIVEVLRLYDDEGCKIVYGIGRTMNGNAEGGWLIRDIWSFVNG